MILIYTPHPWIADGTSQTFM